MTDSNGLPRRSEGDIARLSLSHLEQVVAIDSHSDENSPSIPSTEGQRRLADMLAGFFTALGAKVERDVHANVIANLPGRGTGAARPPLALLVHLDTTHGTAAVPKLGVLPAWDGRPIPYPKNPRLRVDAQTYTAARAFLGQDIVFGPGDRPFGLDDKLGLAHMMTLASLLAEEPAIDHPPLMLIGRPDEEIGRMGAVEGLADLLAARGVSFGYTIDGLEPFEINVENFNASAAEVVFAPRPLAVPDAAAGPLVAVTVALGGVNTHGATAKAEGHRNAVRFAAEIAAWLAPRGGFVVQAASDPGREVDAIVTFAAPARALIEDALRAIVAPHEARGASWAVCDEGSFDAGRAAGRAGGHADGRAGGRAGWHGDAAHGGAAGAAVAFAGAFLASDPGFVLAAEDSEGRQGYSNPFRIAPAQGGGSALTIRLRDFTREALTAREEHVARLAAAAGATSSVRQQYVNMGPRLAGRPELVDHPRRAAESLGIVPRVLPIRGGTGVDPFLDRGVPIANLGTGYFAPESEKEFTSLQLMARHALWLVALVHQAARA